MDGTGTHAGFTGSHSQLAKAGSRYPLLSSTDVYLVGFDAQSATGPEISAIAHHAISVASLADIIKSPTAVSSTIFSHLAEKFERFLVHFDVAVVNVNELPLAENYSRNNGLSYEDTLELLETFLSSP